MRVVYMHRNRVHDTRLPTGADLVRFLDLGTRGVGWAEVAAEFSRTYGWAEVVWTQCASPAQKFARRRAIHAIRRGLDPLMARKEAEYRDPWVGQCWTIDPEAEADHGSLGRIDTPPTWVGGGASLS
jgi:hypothetical protein